MLTDELTRPERSEAETKGRVERGLWSFSSLELDPFFWFLYCLLKNRFGKFRLWDETQSNPATIAAQSSISVKRAYCR